MSRDLPYQLPAVDSEGTPFRYGTSLPLLDWQKRTVDAILGDVFGHDDREFDRELIAVLEDIAHSLRRLARITRLTGVQIMAFPTAPVAPGATDSFTATAVDQNGAVDTAATVTVASSDTSLFTVDGTSAEGVFTGTWTAVADGAVTVTASATDGTTTVDTGSDNPASVTVATPVVLTGVNIA